MSDFVFFLFKLFRFTSENNIMRGKTIKSYFCSLSIICFLAHAPVSWSETTAGDNPDTVEAEETRELVTGAGTHTTTAKEGLEAAREKNVEAAQLADRLAFQIACPDSTQYKNKTDQIWYLKRVFDQWKLSVLKNKVGDQISPANFTQMLEASLTKFGVQDVGQIRPFTEGAGSAYKDLQDNAAKMLKHEIAYDEAKEKSLSVGESKISGAKGTTEWWKLWGEQTERDGKSPYDVLWSKMKYKTGFTKAKACTEDKDAAKLGYRKGLVTEKVGKDGKVTRTYNEAVLDKPTAPAPSTGAVTPTEAAVTPTVSEHGALLQTGLADLKKSNFDLSEMSDDSFTAFKNTAEAAAAGNNPEDMKVLNEMTAGLEARLTQLKDPANKKEGDTTSEQTENALKLLRILRPIRRNHAITTNPVGNKTNTPPTPAPSTTTPNPGAGGVIKLGDDEETETVDEDKEEEKEEPTPVSNPGGVITL